MDSVNDKQLCNIYESNSLRRRPCHILIGKLLALTMEIISLLSHYHIRYLNIISLYFILIYNIWSTEMPERVVSFLDPLVTSPYLLTLLFGR